MFGNNLSTMRVVKGFILLIFDVHVRETENLSKKPAKALKLFEKEHILGIILN